jgi:hypothetical protein
MAKWRYKKCFYYTKKEQSGGVFSASETHEYLKHSDGLEEKLYKDENVDKMLNMLGNSGWELVSTSPIVGQKGMGLAGLFAMDPSGSSVTTTQGVILWFKKIAKEE